MIRPSNLQHVHDPRNTLSLVGSWVRRSRQYTIEHKVSSVDVRDGTAIAVCGKRMRAVATVPGNREPGSIFRCAGCEDAEKRESRFKDEK